MSEYWVSNKKYYCKYCEIFIADDVPSRTHHENGLRHKGNKERFVRSLYKQSERRKHDAEEEQRDMARVEAAALAAFAQDVSAGHAKASSAPGPSKKPDTAAASGSKPPKPSGQFANYSTAESLGITDPDAERAAAEAERKRTQGVVGVWEVVEVDPSAPAQSHAGEDPDSAAVGDKRPAYEPPVFDEEDTRAFKVRKKTWEGLGDLWEPEEVPIKLKVKDKTKANLAAASIGNPLVPELALGAGVVPAGAPTAESSAATPLPKWASKGWVKPGERPSTVDSANVPTEPTPSTESAASMTDTPTKTEEEITLPLDLPLHKDVQPAKPEELEPVAKQEDPVTPAAPSMFKKRKAPAGARGKQ